MKRIFTLWAAFCCLLLVGATAAAQTTVSGKVMDENGEPLVGVNIIVEGTLSGTTTDLDGAFTLRSKQPSPINIKISAIGFETLIQEVNDGDEVEITLKEAVAILGQEVVVSASRHEESILESPVSIEKMGLAAIQNTPSDSYYKALGNLKGIDVATSSIGFQIVNARGFNSTGNTRMVQLIDGMDAQAPGLNFPVGSLNGPNDLDVESLEFIPGAASALYGPNAFNGILLMRSKNPFDYQGLSAMAKVGVNHVDGEDEDPSPLTEFAVRYAKAFNDKFAFKVTASYFQAQDWHNNYDQDQNAAATPEGMSFNPGANVINGFGDEVATNLALLRTEPTITGLLADGFAASLAPVIEQQLIAMGVPPEQAAAQAAAAAAQQAGVLAPQYMGLLPEHVVSRTPYDEQNLVDYESNNLKLGASLHYRFNENMELSYQYNGGFGTSVYTGSNRYSLNDFDIQQHKLELKGDNYFLRAYTTIEDSGDSYDAIFAGIRVNSDALDNSTWFGTYAATYAGAIFAQVAAADPTQVANPDFINQVAATIPLDALHTAARDAADATRYGAGSEDFNRSFENAITEDVPVGGRFNDKTYLWHLEGQYDFSKHIEFFDELQVGANFRRFVLGSNGTIFADSAGNDIDIDEYGAFVQVGKRVWDDKLRFTASVRYDKNENFDGQVNPRFSVVYQPIENHNIRASFQTGFRMPTTQGQHIDLNIGSYRLLGGLNQYADAYNVNHDPANSRYVYGIDAVNQLVAATIAGEPDPTVLNGSEYVHEEVTPEQVRSFEIGYKGLIDDKLLIDVAYYNNTYTDFITQRRVRATNLDPFTDPNGIPSLLSGDGSNTYQIYGNLDQDLTAQGLVAGLQYALGKGFNVGGNYNWNKLDDIEEEGLLTEFNTPEHKFNLTFANEEVIDNIGFSIAYRWQDEVFWESSYAIGTVDAFSTVDAQVSYTIKDFNTVIKLGGSNIFNQRYTQNYGGPTIGAIYYVSVTYDQFMN